MAATLFKDSTYNLANLVDAIRRGEIALPDIQRPFVWKAAKVRDLFDSMYKGFPVGFLLFWATGAEAGARQIGTEGKEAPPRLLIVDGQQRLTSLFAVLTGAEIVRKDYSVGRIRIAFRPDDRTFAVTDAAIDRDPEFIADITKIFQSPAHGFTKSYLSSLEEYRGDDLDDDEADDLAEAIDRLRDLKNYPFKVIELEADVEEEQVADVFVRINSEGVQLNQADFILTLMSVFWEKGRRALEEFSRLAKQPSSGQHSPYNHFIQPSPDQMLRAAVGLAFRRGRLQAVYSILRGKDLDSGKMSPERRQSQFDALREAQESALDLTNWHEFLRCLAFGGFRRARMISSESAVLYTYVLWLIGHRDFSVDRRRLREVIGRWFFMAHTTGRYTSSPETQLESDLARLRTVAGGDAEGFCSVLDRIIGDTFTNDYWNITLPNRLDSSAAKSPALSAYWAALNVLDAELLFSDAKIATLLDPGVTPVRNIERHHLFPKAYLTASGITETTHVNAIANMAFVDWSDNAEIAARPPAEYWPVMRTRVGSERLKRQVYWHALPIGWEQLAYDEFLEKRRKLIAQIVRDAFERLADGYPDPPSPAPSPIRDLVAGGESNVVEFKSTARWNLHTGAKDSKLEHVVVKTVAGFMNAEGGTLLIGIADDGAVVGLDKDYAVTHKGNRDGFELFLTQLLDVNLSGPAATLVRTSFEIIDGQDVCRVDVSAAARPVFAKPHQGGKQPSEFWLRIGNQTRQLVGAELMEYREAHWGS